MFTHTTHSTGRFPPVNSRLGAPLDAGQVVLHLLDLLARFFRRREGQIARALLDGFCRAKFLGQLVRRSVCACVARVGIVIVEAGVAEGVEAFVLQHYVPSAH